MDKNAYNFDLKNNEKLSESQCLVNYTLNLFRKIQKKNQSCIFNSLNIKLKHQFCQMCTTYAELRLYIVVRNEEFLKVKMSETIEKD